MANHQRRFSHLIRIIHMTMMRFHDPFMKMGDRKLHALLTMDGFSKSAIIYATKQEPIRRVRAERVLFIRGTTDFILLFSIF